MYKKIICLLLITLTTLFLTSCRKENSEQLKILIPSGTPALTIANIMNTTNNGEEQIENLYLNHEIVFGSDPLIAGFTSKSHDIIYAPTNLGANIYNKNSNYSLAAVIVWGTNYIISDVTSKITSIETLANNKIYAFGEKSTPDAVLQLILKRYEVDKSITIEYGSDAATSTSMFLANKEPIILISEPMLSKIMDSRKLNIIDLQKEWEKLTGKIGYPQVGIFVRKDLFEKPKTLDKYFHIVSNEIQFMLTKTNEYAQSAIKADATFSNLGISIIEQSITTSNYRFSYASEVKEDIKFYLKKLHEFNPGLVGGKIPDEEFYGEIKK